jgi:hypothetical protein
MKHFLTAVTALAGSGPSWARPAPTNPPASGVNAPAPVQSLNRMPGADARHPNEV